MTTPASGLEPETSGSRIEVVDLRDGNTYELDPLDNEGAPIEGYLHSATRDNLLFATGFGGSQLISFRDGTTDNVDIRPLSSRVFVGDRIYVNAEDEPGTDEPAFFDLETKQVEPIPAPERMVSENVDNRLRILCPDRFAVASPYQLFSIRDDALVFGGEVDRDTFRGADPNAVRFDASIDLRYGLLQSVDAAGKVWFEIDDILSSLSTLGGWPIAENAAYEWLVLDPYSGEITEPPPSVQVLIDRNEENLPWWDDSARHFDHDAGVFHAFVSGGLVTLPTSDLCP